MDVKYLVRFLFSINVEVIYNITAVYLRNQNGGMQHLNCLVFGVGAFYPCLAVRLRGEG